MHLQDGGGVHRADWAFDGVSDDLGFGGAEGEQQHLPCSHDAAPPHRDAVHGYVFRASEVPRRISACLFGERFDPGAGSERRRLFVETDVPFTANAEDLEIDASDAADRLFVVATKCGDILRLAVGDVNTIARDVDVVEQVLPHESVIALWMIWTETDVLVEVERGHTGKIEAFLAMHAREFAIHRERRAACCQAEHAVGLLADEIGDDVRSDETGGFRCGLNDDFHGISYRPSRLDSLAMTSALKRSINPVTYSTTSVESF